MSAWRDGRLSLVYSPEILEEYRRVGARLARQFEGVDPGPFLALVVNEGQLFESPALEEPVGVDPEDDKFLACAIVSECGVIVSGDKHLLQATGYKGIDVLRPRTFAENYL